MEYEVIRSKRKTLALTVTVQGQIIVRAPVRCNEKIIEAFVLKHGDWINRNLENMLIRRKKAEAFVIDDADIQQYICRAKEYIPERTAYWSKVTGLEPAYVKITSAKKRYGSCNGKNGICFSFRLMVFPEKAIDYVIVHELAHIKYKNHSAQFYDLIERYIPEYKEYENILRFKGD